MKTRLALSVVVLALSLTLLPAAVASTTWYVDGVNGNDSNNCLSPTTACKTIGHAISLSSSGDSISVAAATYTENLTISVSLKLIGAGATTTIIDGGAVNTVVTISSAGAHVTLSKVTIRNGSAINGGGISNSGTLTISNSIISRNTATHTSAGGGIYNTGSLTINNSTLSGNSVIGLFCGSCSGGGIYNSGTVTITHSAFSANNAPNGGGIYNYVGGTLTISGSMFSGICCSALYNAGGTLTISNSTLSGNTTGLGAGGAGIISFSSGTLIINNSTLSSNSTGEGGAGGAVSNDATATINNSTLSGNDAGIGGGVFNNDNGSLTINNSTLSGNTLELGGVGAGIYTFGTVTLQNTIVANISAGGDCGGTITSNGYNLSSDNTCNFNGPGDLNNTDPKLGPLQNNGGPTQTQALLSGSPAIDGGNSSGCTDGNGHLLKTDQRGQPRPDKEDAVGCDMGAYEKQTD